MQEKTFFLQNQLTNKSQLVKFKIPTFGPLVNLQKLIETIPDAPKKIFKIYNPEKDNYIVFNNNNLYMQPYTISRDLLKLNVLMIKYTDNPDQYDIESGSRSQSEDQNKKQRSRQRNIREVIQLVQRWRELHDNPQEGKRKTLQEAARIVGVSKKSLDDYYYQLRVGEKHDFDFQAHLQEKIGVLRAFIKQKEPQRKVEGKNSKHPKKLRIIQQFAQKLRITENSSNENKSNTIQVKSQQMESHSQPQMLIQDNFELNRSLQTPVNQNSNIQSANQDQLFWGTPFTPLSQENFINCEKNFYNDFQFSLDEIGDPYLQFLPFNNLTSKKSNTSQDQI